MGVFDYVMVPCPRCGKKVETTSKGAAFPFLDRYDLEAAPLDVLSDVNRYAPFTCPRCNARFEVEVITTSRVRQLAEDEVSS